MEIKRKTSGKQYLKIMGVLTLLALVVIVWYMVGKSLYKYPRDCEPLMITWCTNCKNENWVEGEKVGEGLAWCSNSRYNTGWTPETDCTVNNAKEICGVFIIIQDIVIQ